jgi:phosphopantothenoylcysteine decarboxylase
MLLGGIAEKYNPVMFRSFMDLKTTIYDDEDEWKDYEEVGRDPVLHIDLTKWADVLLIAPLSANTLAKLANGLCDNLLSCVCRAWPMKMKPLVVRQSVLTMVFDIYTTTTYDPHSHPHH